MHFAIILICNTPKCTNNTNIGVSNAGKGQGRPSFYFEGKGMKRGFKGFREGNIVLFNVFRIVNLTG